MEHYTEIIKNRLEDLTGDGRTREEILKDWSEGNTEDDFGNLSGSRTFSTYQAQKDLEEAGFPWDDEINQLLGEGGYNAGELVEKGAEIVDVIICELLAPIVADELREA